jgi:hypothetical protein
MSQVNIREYFYPLVTSNFGWSDQDTYQATREACGHEFKPLWQHKWLCEAVWAGASPDMKKNFFFVFFGLICDF